jgi:streptogramin lyase
VNTDSAFGGGDTRHMTIDPNNNLWIGSFNSGGLFIRVNGTTGAIETPVKDNPCGGYGGAIDGNGVIWSSSGTGPLLRWDPAAPDSATNPVCHNEVPTYGVALDSNGFIWTTDFGATVRKTSPDGNTTVGPFPHGAQQAQGLAAAPNGDIWVSSSLNCSSNCTVGHLKNDGTLVGSVPNPTGSGSTGVAVDANGKIWTANRASNTATRIDPDAGPLGCGGTG